MTTFTEMAEAIDEANATMARADSYAKRMGRIVRQRMRRLDGETLEDMKRQLRKFDMQTHRWND